MVKVYLSGAISYVQNAIMMFDRTETILRDKGYEVVNPTLVPLPKGKEESEEYNEVGEWVWYMRRCLPLLVGCDKMLLLLGWEDSRGANLEKKLAEELKITVYHDIKDLDELRKS